MSDTATQRDTQSIVVEDFLPHAPDIVWRVLTDGALIGRWLKMAPTGFAPVPGTRFSFQTTPAGAWDGVIRCEVLDVRRAERLSYSWQGGHEDNAQYGSLLDTVVTWTLAAVDGGTRLKLVHSGFVTPRNDVALKNLGGGWNKIMGRIAGVAGELTI